MTVVVRSEYGWSGDGKSAAEIAADIEHTRHRLRADIQALASTLLAPRRLVPLVSLAIAGVSFLLRRVRHRR